ncbi:glycosyltransferase [Salinisphaera sp. Q1T1-3]|uniref:glycosyltransferase n=1 Tax=Salinisphaera sp. Q1T1-3 TaxID=2321229 RepID=UPI000E76FE9E|nr:glycosyltransferase [Salinisphaera sp. Q1T1-3]RJS94728.1 hypothetical protein D3260_02835 [Salinisphaera sp. Q1T1-3]
MVDDAAQWQHRALLVAFHYPPLAASPGALRARAFAAYLPTFGWQPHVLAPDMRAYDPDSCESDGVVPGIVHRSRALDARRHFGWRHRYMAWTAAPDRWVSWAPGAILTGLRVIRRHDIQVIWSTYPIATAHLVAGTLARLSGRPWIAEFRDPMTVDGSPIQRRALGVLERFVMRHADHLIFATPGAARDCCRRFPEIAGRCSVIPNGYDPALQTMTQPRARRGDGPLRVVHSGQLYPTDRDPTVFFETLAAMRRAGRIDAERVHIVFRNTQQEAECHRHLTRLGLSDMVEIAPRIGHAQALAEQAAADALLVLQGRGFNRQVPAKLFEYLRAGRPIFALVDPDGDTQALLDELDVGVCGAPDDPAAIENALATLCSRLEVEGSDSAVWQADDDRLSRYSRRHATRTLAAHLDRLTERKSPAASFD